MKADCSFAAFLSWEALESLSYASSVMLKTKDRSAYDRTAYSHDRQRLYQRRIAQCARVDSA